MKRFRNILVTVDNRTATHPELQWAVRLARHNQAKLKLVDVVPEFSWIARLAIADVERTRQILVADKIANLEAIAEPLRSQGFDVATKVLFGKTSFEIIHEVLRSDHDLVLRVTKGVRSRRTGYFGTTGLRLLRKCPCAVWLVRPDTAPRFARILAAVDPAVHDVAQEIMNKTIVELGLSIAGLESGELHVVHAWDLGMRADESWATPDQVDGAMRKAKSVVASAFNEFLSSYQLDHQNVHLLRDETGPGHAIAELAKQQDIDLIVMGTLARTGLAGALMGNTAEQVIDRVRCSVLTIKPNEFISPVTLPDT